MSETPPPPRPDAPPLATPAPGRPAPVLGGPPASRWLVLPGFSILTGCLLVGEWAKARFGLVLPGNILGLFLLLVLLSAGVVPLRWVEGAARGLLWLLPLLFLPIFVLAMRDQKFWAVQGRALAGAVALGTIALWAVVGHLSQWMLKKRMKDEGGKEPAGR